jgi:phosphoesterase RecJ-like protein
VLNNAEYYDNNKIIGSVIDYRNLEKLEDETDGLVNLLRNINDVEISFLIKEDKPNHFRISLRSTNQVDVSIVASKFDGGGHFSAAGFSYVGDRQELKSKIVEEILMVKKKASNYQSE